MKGFSCLEFQVSYLSYNQATRQSMGTQHNGYTSPQSSFLASTYLTCIPSESQLLKLVLLKAKSGSSLSRKTRYSRVETPSNVELSVAQVLGNQTCRNESM
jgi:hypothetical protein